MSLLTYLLAGLAAFEHLFILYLETFATHSPRTSKVFGMAIEELKRPSVTTLFQNQGVYNGMVAAGLFYGLATQNSEITGLFLIFIIAVASYGAYSSQPKILLTQGGPAILALLSLLF